MALLHLYQGNPTAGGTDGTEISSGTENAPVTITLDASKAETKAAKIAVRCDANYSIEGGVAISFTGTNAGKWQVAADDGYTNATALANASWASSVTLSGVAATNKCFWVKATSATSELPANDRSVDVLAEGLVVAAE